MANSPHSSRNDFYGAPPESVLRLRYDKLPAMRKSPRRHARRCAFLFNSLPCSGRSCRKHKPRVRAYVPTEVARQRGQRGSSERNIRRKLRRAAALDKLGFRPGGAFEYNPCELEALADLVGLDTETAKNLARRSSKGEWVSARTVLAAIAANDWTFGELREFCRMGDCAPLPGTRLRRR